MSAPDPEGMTMLAKVLGAASVVAVPIWGFVKLWNKKADKREVAEQFQGVKDELSIQRGHIGKVFDQMRDMEKVSEDRHRELMMHLLERKP